MNFLIRPNLQLQRTPDGAADRQRRAVTMIRYLLTILILVPLAAVRAAGVETLFPKAANCSLRSIPKDAGELETHASTLSFYPRVLPAQYTGCKLVWLKDGKHLLSVTYFEKGRVIAALLSEPDEDPFVCHYVNESLVVEKSNSRCPLAEKLH